MFLSGLYLRIFFEVSADNIAAQCGIKIPLALLGICGEAIKVAYAYRTDRAERSHAAFSHVAATLVGILSALLAVLGAARTIFQWDATELNYQYANLVVFLAVAALLTPGIARGHYREIIKVIDYTVRKLQCGRPRARALYDNAEVSCLSRLFSCCRRRGGERARLVGEDDALGAQVERVDPSINQPDF